MTDKEQHKQLAVIHLPIIQNTQTGEFFVVAMYAVKAPYKELMHDALQACGNAAGNVVLDTLRSSDIWEGKGKGKA